MLNCCLKTNECNMPMRENHTSQGIIWFSGNTQRINLPNAISVLLGIQGIVHTFGPPALTGIYLKRIELFKQKMVAFRESLSE